MRSHATHSQFAAISRRFFLTSGWTPAHWQLFTELRGFFPHNSVTIFFSHFDFYRPESYAPVSQNFVEKASQTNPKIDALRHEATRSLFERRDTIVVATVSCIYGLGMPQEYLEKATAM